MKTLTIPQKELLVYILLRELFTQVPTVLNSRISVNDVFYWSVSEVVLCRIKGKEKKAGKLWVKQGGRLCFRIRKLLDREINGIMPEAVTGDVL